MLAQSIRLGRILGIPIGVNYSWFLIFVVLTQALALRFGEFYPDWTSVGRLGFGLVASLLFFSSVLLHELGHSVMALHYGIPVRSITLFVFGGVAQIGREPEKPTHELVIAVAGPLVSAALGAAFLGLQWLTVGTADGLATLGGWLGGVNLTLAVFNLVPGFPLDGGRMLRAVVWRVTGSFERATRIAASSGRVFAVGFILLGVIQAVAGSVLGGLWIALIGWFLFSAAQASAAEVQLHRALAGVTAADVARVPACQVDGETSVAALVERMGRTGERCSMVMGGDRLLCSITPRQLEQVPRADRATTPVRSLVVPQEQLSSVGSDTPVETVLERMNEAQVSQIPVVENGRLVGVIALDQVLAFAQNRLELRA